MYAIFDERGRRMVMPRHSSGEAIELIAGALVGKGAPLSKKLTAWEGLRVRGYRLVWVSNAHGVRRVAAGSK